MYFYGISACKGTCKWALMNTIRLHGSQRRGRHVPPHSQGPHLLYPQNRNLRALSWRHSCLILTDKWAHIWGGKWRRPSGSHFLDWQVWKEKGLSECSHLYISDTLFFLPLQSQNTIKDSLQPTHLWYSLLQDWKTNKNLKLLEFTKNIWKCLCDPKKQKYFLNTT